MKATIYTIIALIAFAANSLFCRMALAGGYIDAWSFTVIRLLSAAVCLVFIMTIHAYKLQRQVLASDKPSIDAILNDKGSWLSSVSLVIYALCFSIAYVELNTGTGALILSSAVQITMIGWGIYKKEQLSALQWLAFVVAVAGFVYLMLPSAAIPSPLAAALMAMSGIAWGVYSIRGKSCVSPLRATGFNFVRSLVAVPILLLVGMTYLDNLFKLQSNTSKIQTKSFRFTDDEDNLWEIEAKIKIPISYELEEHDTHHFIRRWTVVLMAPDPKFLSTSEITQTGSEGFA